VVVVANLLIVPRIRRLATHPSPPWPRMPRGRIFSSVRVPLETLVIVWVCAACERGEATVSRKPAIAPVVASLGGPDPLLLRAPHSGGVARVSPFGDPDSTIWQSTGVLPPLSRILAFDDDEGTIAFVDQRGRAGQLDLRSGSVTLSSRDRLLSAASISGSTIFGVGPGGSVLRMMATGTWTFDPPRPARLVFPEQDTSILVVGGDSGATVAWRIRPPIASITDSLRVPPITRAVSTPMGDRVYFASSTGLFAVDIRTLKITKPIRSIRTVTALAVTPSGDRVFVVADSSREIQVVDRYRNEISVRIALPGRGSELRVDPLGRYLLVKISGKDSVWIVGIGTNQLVGTVPSIWRGDIPFVAPGGSIVTGVGRDVWFIDPITMRPSSEVQDGTSDFWFGFWWTGFRPQMATVGQPVTADTLRDSVAADVAPTVAAADTARPSALPAHDSQGGCSNGFWVQFAAYLVQQRAQSLAARIHVGTANASIVVGLVGGVPIYRVDLGPYPTKDAATQVAAASGEPSPFIHCGPP